MSGRSTPNLKDMIAHDVESGCVFFNPDDFGEPHDIDGKTMMCVVERVGAAAFSDGVGGKTANRSPNDVSRALSRTYTREVRIFVRVSDWGARPAIGFGFVLDRIYQVRLIAVDISGGVYLLTGKENDL